MSTHFSFSYEKYLRIVYLAVALNNCFYFSAVSLRELGMLISEQNRSNDCIIHKVLMKWQFVITHTIRQTEVLALPDDWGTYLPSVKLLHSKNLLVLMFL